MDIQQFYRSVAKTGSLIGDESGAINAVLGDKSEPKLVDGKRLVFPTTEQLRNPDWESRIAFHPMAENILRGESPVLEALRKAFNIRLNLVASALTFELLILAASQAKHASLNPDQSAFLMKVSDVGDKEVTFLKDLLKKMPFDQTQFSFMSLYLKRGGTVGGKRHARVGVINFPLHTALIDKDPKVFGVKPSSVKVRQNLIALIEQVIPNQGVAEEYNRGSDSSDAPYFEALLLATLAVAAPLNDIVELFRDQLEDPDSLVIESDWVEALPDFQSFARKIPSLKGNEGAPNKGDETASTVVAAAPMAAIPAAAPNVPGQIWPTAPAPVPATNMYQPPVSNEGGGISFADLARVNPALSGHMHSQPQPQFGGYQPNAFGMVPNNYGGQPNVMPGSGSAVGGTNWGGQPQQQNNQFAGTFNSIFNQPNQGGYRI